MYTPEMMGQIERIRAIDPAAADYLMGDEIWQLPKGDFAPTARGLSGLMVWRLTPQGHDYWDALHRATREDDDG